MKLDTIPASWIVAGLALAAGALWLASRAAVSGASIATELGVTLGGAAVDAGAGVVLGVGDAIGIPRTEQGACQRALAAGDWWDASFACPAGDFMGAVFGGDNNTGSVSGNW